MMSLDHLASLRPFLREQDLVEGQLYVMTEPKKIMLDMEDMFCYVASVDGQRRLNMSLRTSISMDRVARVMDLSSNEMLLMQLKMRAVRNSPLPDGRPNPYNYLQLVVEDVKNIGLCDPMTVLHEEEEDESVALAGLDLSCVQASGSGVQGSGSGLQASRSDVGASGSDVQTLGSDDGVLGSSVKISGDPI